MKTVSALILHHASPTGGVLICKNENGTWKFPKTEIRTNETPEEAVERLASIKLKMTVKAGKLIMIGRNRPNDGYVEHLACGNITHNTNSKDNYHLYYAAVNVWQTEPQCCCGCEFKWVAPSELGQYEFEGDDKNFMAKYVPYVAGEFIADVRMF